MKNVIIRKMRSDKAASNTTETIIIIALAVFAALALFTFILRPVQESADDLGTGIGTWMNDLMESQGTGVPEFNGGLGGGGLGGGEAAK